MKMKKHYESGITLIALVITILVLLILAGVTIASINGESGILQEAADTKINTEKAKKEENADIQQLVDFMKVSTNKNSIARKIKPENYGDPIEYSANGVSDWNIFYNDGTYVYIIAREYLDNQYLPTGARLGTLADYPHSAYWPKSGDQLTGLIGSFNIDSVVADKYKLSWLKSYPESTNKNIKAVSTLLDTTVWAPFADSTFADSAIGTPTLDMFAESWNEKYEGDTQLYYDCMTDIGYYVTTIAPDERTEEVNTTYTSLEEEIGYSDTLYFPHKEAYNNSKGYWLAAPSSYQTQGETTVTYVYYTGSVGASSEGCCGTGSADTAGADFSIRPVVCIKADVEATKVDGIWKMNLAE